MNAQGAALTSHWAGLDWSDDEHVVVIVDAASQPVKHLVVENTAAGLQELVDALRAVPALGGIALESTRALVVHTLIHNGFNVYPINPKMSASWRDAWTVAGVKSDDRDAQALAAGLAAQHTTLKRLTPETGLARELALLCEDELNFIAERAGLVIKLKATLKQYFPTVLTWFNEWTKPVAWAFLRKYTTAEDLAKAGKKNVYAFLKAQHLRITPQRLQTLDHLADYADLDDRSRPTVGPPGFRARSFGTCMGSMTSRSLVVSCVSDTPRVAFRTCPSRRRSGQCGFAAQYPAHTCPGQRLPHPLSGIQP